MITRFLRPAQKMLTGTVVAAVAATCLVSATGTGPMAAKEGARTGSHATVQAKKEYVVDPGTKEYAAPLVDVSTSVYPAMGSTAYEVATLRAINAVRRAHGRHTLTFAPCANRVANRWSAHLASTNGFYHQSMTHLLSVCHAHYVGETLGMGSVSPTKLVQMWMASPEHHHILMSRAPRRIGIGSTPNAQGQWVTAADFMHF